MLNVSFFTIERQMTERIEFNPNFQEWLLQSAFFQIGQDELLPTQINDRKVEKTVVSLNTPTRQKMIDFLYETIVEETKVLLYQIEDLAIHDELTYRLSKLIAILDCVKNPQHYYLQRH
jgi:hypothetical protein